MGNNLGIIRNSYTAASIYGGAGNDNIGGMIGHNDGSKAVVENSYAATIVYGEKGSDFIGGLVGRNNIGSLIKNSYSTSILHDEDFTNRVGGLVGLDLSTVEQSYYIAELTIATINEDAKERGIEVLEKDLQIPMNFNFRSTSNGIYSSWSLKEDHDGQKITGDLICNQPKLRLQCPFSK